MGVTIINDDSSAEAVAKLRAMNEAGNVTWDVVDVVAADAIRLCDEGLAMEIDPDTNAGCCPRWHPSLRRFRRPAGFRLLHSTDRLLDDLRLPHRPGWRHCLQPASALCSTPKHTQASARWKSAQSTTWNGLCFVTALQKTQSMTFWALRRRPGSGTCQTGHHQRRCDLVVCWC